MANRRMIQKCLSYCVEFNSLTDFEKVLYLLTIPHLDDFGRISADPRVLKAMVLPMDNRDTSTLSEALNHIVEQKLFCIYENDGERVLICPTFEEDQTGLNKRTKSKYPEPPVDVSKKFSEVPRFYKPTEPIINESKGSEVNKTEVNDKRELNTSVSNKEEYTGKIPTEGFKPDPNNYEENKVWEIAKCVGEEYMDFLLGILKKYGFGLIEDSYGEYRESKENEESKGKKIENPPAYLNAIIQKRAIKRTIDTARGGLAQMPK